MQSYCVFITLAGWLHSRFLCDLRLNVIKFIRIFVMRFYACYKHQQQQASNELNRTRARSFVHLLLRMLPTIFAVVVGYVRTHTCLYAFVPVRVRNSFSFRLNFMIENFINSSHCIRLLCAILTYALIQYKIQ